MYYVLSAGTNLGDRLANLTYCREALDLVPGTHVVSASAVYQTQPVGYARQDDFYNVCFLVESRLNPHEMLGVCLGHQLLGYFAGAEVSRAPYVMHGKSSDIIHDGAGLFSGLPNPMTVGRYHSLVVQSKEDEPNPRFTVTSRGPEGEVMALRYNCLLYTSPSPRDCS